MPKFKFTLASVLRLRENDRDQRRADLAEALEVQQTLQQRTDSIKQKLTDADAGRRAPAGTVDVDALLDAERYRAVLRSQKAVIDEQSARLAEEIEQRRQRLVEADRDVRLLEKLKETQQQRFQQELARSETKQLDEAASRRWDSGDRALDVPAWEDFR